MFKTTSLSKSTPSHQAEISECFTVTANTFTPLYSAKEDRIRVAINYSDYTKRVDFWITRSFLLKLLPAWEEYFYRYAPGDAPNTNTASNDSAIPNTSQTDAGNLELMKKEAILLESVDMQFDRKNNRFKITMKGSNAEAFAYLSPHMMIALLRSIFQSVPHMQWGISPALLG